MQNFEAIALSIAGSDSSGGAGIQADIKSGAGCGTYFATAITAITAQNGYEVTAIQNIDGAMVSAQIEAVVKDMNVQSVKCGMLPTIESVDAVIESIEKFNLTNVVIDPVMVATSGATLISDDVARKIVSSLIPLASLVTPNAIEASFITGEKIECVKDFDKAAECFKALGVKYLLMKGGHVGDGKITDKLYNFASGKSFSYVFNKIDTQNTHGTGCSLSSAIAAYLAQGFSMEIAVEKAEEYLHAAIESGKDKLFSHGNGSILHLYKLWQNLK